MEQKERSLEQTPVWAVSIVCLALIFISLLFESVLHFLTKFLKKRKKKSLKQALGNIKTELMMMGFISLLLTVAEVPISKICVTEAVANSLLPCDSKEATASTATQITDPKLTFSTETIDESHCEAKGKVSLLSREGVEQLHIFIFVLTVFHVLYCVLTMSLGLAKMRRWKAWEKETKTLEYQIANDPRRFRLTRQTSFGRRHLKFWSDHSILLWPVCFLRQFSRSVTKADYFTLRNGFIVAHLVEGTDFDFREFLGRAFDADFAQVVGMRFWIWIFSILFIFFNAHGFYNYFWLPFIPLLMVLMVGTKLEVIITKLCLESSNNTAVVHGTFLVKPTDNLFWFGRPHLLLHLIHFILFQNSFQLAFFTWTWYEFGLRSCFHRKTEDIALRIAMGVTVQFLCGYVTLPLYALVTQMGSAMKAAVFTERVSKGLKRWHSQACQNLSRNKSTTTRNSSETWTIDATDTSFSEKQEFSPEQDNFPPSINKSSTRFEITNEEVQHKVLNGITYDGEISFGTSWKELGKGKVENIALVLDENIKDTSVIDECTIDAKCITSVVEESAKDIVLITL